MKFAIVLNNEVKEYKDFPSQPECKYINGLPTVRPVTELSAPAYDEATHKLSPTVQIFDNRVEIGYEVVALTPGELQARIPTIVSMYQARTALSRAGLLSTVEAALASMPDQSGEEARIKWEYATDVRRDDALVAAMAGILNLDSAGLDNLFTTASEII